VEFIVFPVQDKFLELVKDKADADDVDLAGPQHTQFALCDLI
jgi:hypothetical protein